MLCLVTAVYWKLVFIRNCEIEMKIDDKSFSGPSAGQINDPIRRPKRKFSFTYNHVSESKSSPIHQSASGKLFSCPHP